MSTSWPYLSEKYEKVHSWEWTFVHSKLMENGLAVFKGADITKGILQNLAGFKGILAYPVCGVGIGTHGNDLPAKFLESSEIVSRGQKIAAAIHATGIYL